MDKAPSNFSEMVNDHFNDVVNMGWVIQGVLAKMKLSLYNTGWIYFLNPLIPKSWNSNI